MFGFGLAFDIALTILLALNRRLPITKELTHALDIAIRKNYLQNNSPWPQKTWQEIQRCISIYKRLPDHDPKLLEDISTHANKTPDTGASPSYKIP